MSGRTRLRVAVAAVSLAALAACSADGVLRPDADILGAAPQGFDDPVVVAEPVVAAYPRFDAPAVQTLTYSPDEAECRRELKRLKVEFENLPSISDGGSCGIAYPVKMSRIGRVQVKPAATLTCQMALTFARWTRKELVPAARYRYWSGVKTIHQGSSYSCRNIAGTRTASEHASGNAIDIMRIELNDGKDIDVRKPGWFSFRQRGFLNTVRHDGCSYFSTVLGPGYNADHKDHFHFDIKERRNGHVACR